MGYQGIQGPAGPPGSGNGGTAATIQIGSVTTLPAGSPATVTNSGTASNAVFNFGIPAGKTGNTGSPGINGLNGQAATIQVGTVSQLPAGSTPTVQNVGSSTNAVFNFGFPTPQQPIKPILIPLVGSNNPPHPPTLRRSWSRQSQRAATSTWTGTSWATRLHRLNYQQGHTRFGLKQGAKSRGVARSV